MGTGGGTRYQPWPKCKDLARTTKQGTVIIKVDNKTAPRGWGNRRSIRISSHQRYNGGLFILDTKHLPTGCATWPAWWLTCPKWPEGGEIDIIEHANIMSHTQHTLHTTRGCDYTHANIDGFTGKWARHRNCYVKSDRYNSGCGIEAPEGTAGKPWNEKGGGVHVMLWDQKTGIKVWDIPRKDVKKYSWMKSSMNTITDEQLTSLGTPTSFHPFGSHCSSTHFKDNVIVLNIALCGGWPNGHWGDSGCKTKTKKHSCPAYVAKAPPSAFDSAYFEINYLKVFKHSGSVTPGALTVPHTLSHTQSSSACGYVPPSCDGDIKWAVHHGKWHPSWYKNFKSITGYSLYNANYEDMQLYFNCTKTNPRGHCGGLQAPCNRKCNA